MPPGAISTVSTACIRLRHRWVSLNPLEYVIIIPLLRPQHSSIGLALQGAQIIVLNSFLQLGIELIRIDDSVFKYLVKIRKWISLRHITQTHTIHFLASRRNFIRIFYGSLRTNVIRIYGMFILINHIFINPIFRKMRQIIGVM